MNSKERFHAVMNFKPFDKLPLVEWASWWDKTIDRWHGEGLPENLTDRYDLYDHFGLEQYKQVWFRPISPGAPEPAHHGASLIKNEQEYEVFKNKYLYKIDEKYPIDPELWTKWAKEQQDGNTVIFTTVDGFFWFPRTLFGIEDHLFAFYDQSELMHRMNQDITEWIIKCIDRVCEFCNPDFFVFGEDMSYNHGPMLSEDMFNEFLLPYYQKVIPHLRKKGIMPIIDSDGDISTAAEWFQRAGLDGILPLERQAGVDIAKLRNKYPKMRWIGHFDKMTMSEGEAAMRAEFERLLPTAAKGGFIISCDHQTPPGVSLENYHIYLKLFNEYAEKAGIMSQKLL